MQPANLATSVDGDPEVGHGSAWGQIALTAGWGDMMERAGGVGFSREPES